MVRQHDPDPGSRGRDTASHGNLLDDFLEPGPPKRFDPTAGPSLFAAAAPAKSSPPRNTTTASLSGRTGTGDRTPSPRTPRYLIQEIADAVRAVGVRFGVYYSGGLDWSVSNFAPHQTFAEVHDLRPVDPAYNAYALLHVRDLIERYDPAILWNDIDWPDAGKRTGAWSLHELFTDFYAGRPDGVVNDRWGDTHWDFRTTEYSAGAERESAAQWENCRGIGFSFGYNQVEGTDQLLTGHQLARLLGDLVSRGGRLLLNVGPTAAGEIPAPSRSRCADSAAGPPASVTGYGEPAPGPTAHHRMTTPGSAG